MLLPKMTIIRCSRHLRRVASCGCAVPGCRLLPVHAHHDRRDGRGGMGMKPSDFFALPLCYYHHAEGHQHGWEWFEDIYALDLRAIAAWHAFVSRQMGMLKPRRLAA